MRVREQYEHVCMFTEYVTDGGVCVCVCVCLFVFVMVSVYMFISWSWWCEFVGDVGMSV